MNQEAELISRAKAGDHEALVELLRSIENSVYRSAYYILGNEQDALDATQEALIRVYRKIDSYQERAKFSTWVQRIVSNICIDKFRSRKETISIEQHELSIPDQHSVEEEILYNGLTRDIESAIQKLPEQYRMVVVFRYLRDMSYQEIADALEIPLNTVKSYLFRARQQLQQMLYDYQKGGIG
ncbi:RNA polymerase sigma factor [Brevibacillus fulvus]|uniref:RNA polymerase sigma-70 factor (ECF subfamily) n=1 Tax=Brevibacillus fulvus TaxID=1125967 RepID=A0A938XXD1_9BACL|nr:sigma-70 family RNA polymerase sigma factor [Brevibacillus fulvus]MBM7589899.1 RNA polymerase sigma-70 factor (ECF subfamily) [Brevibacillus fulvus]